MADYQDIPTRTANDVASFADFNQGQKNIEDRNWTFTVEGVAQAGANVISFQIPITVKPIEFRTEVDVAPAGSNMKFDLNINGSSITSTRLSIATGATVGTLTSFDTNTLTKFEVASIDYDQVGSATNGGDNTYHYLRVERLA